ncbi:DNA alkylation repair enzyme [uncultured archaeon]|nr:DNA alkylation repair enzyme [uncultured archaeon]
MTSSYSAITKDLQALRNPEKAKLLQRFFKTGKGQYGEGDVFLGIVVPKQREVVKKHWKKAGLADLQQMLSSKIHEYRLVALLMLVEQYKQAEKEKDRARCKAIFDFYLKQAGAGRINNWDLVDSSAPYIVGGYLHALGGEEWKKVLVPLAKSEKLWERRIAVLATLYFTVKGQHYEPARQMCEMVLQDSHDLMHKASGWMLREVGKRGGEGVLREFLDQHAKRMPRTMLRYAIERMDEKSREKYMQKGPKGAKRSART